MTVEAVADPRLWTTLDHETPHTRVFLFYGQSGSGKSLLTAQIPNVLVLGCDPGEFGGLPDTALIYKPKFIKVKDYQQLVQLIPKLASIAGKEFTTLAVDSVSYVTKLYLDSILKTVGREIPRFEEWNLLATRMRNFIKQICELDCNVVFTATDSVSKDETTGKMLGGPNLPGKLAIEIPQACDVVARFYADTIFDPKTMKKIAKYKFQTTPDTMWYAKDRTGTLPIEGETDFETFKHLFIGKEKE